MEAWHFLKAGGFTGEGNLKVVEGETMRVNGEIKFCHSGLHFSVKALDALNYAPGPIVQRVWVPDDSILGDDKGVARERKCLWMYDATNILHEFACQCAEAALMIADVDDERSWNAIHVKRELLAGRATDADLAAARAAARAAAWDAAWADMEANLEYMLIQALDSNKP
jgi:hypothetical protein